MRIKIEEVLDAARGSIRFRSGAASVEGRWAGTGEVSVGREVDVELEVAEEKIISARPTLGLPADPVAQEGGEVVIAGRTERVGDDGIIEFRVGQDVILLERIGALADVVEGTHLELRVPELELYPRDL